MKRMKGKEVTQKRGGNDDTKVSRDQIRCVVGVDVPSSIDTKNLDAVKDINLHTDEDVKANDLKDDDMTLIRKKSDKAVVMNDRKRQREKHTFHHRRGYLEHTHLEPTTKRFMKKQPQLCFDRLQSYLGSSEKQSSSKSDLVAARREKGRFEDSAGKGVDRARRGLYDEKFSKQSDELFARKSCKAQTKTEADMTTSQSLNNGRKRYGLGLKVGFLTNTENSTTFESSTQFIDTTNIEHLQDHQRHIARTKSANKTNREDDDRTNLPKSENATAKCTRLNKSIIIKPTNTKQAKPKPCPFCATTEHNTRFFCPLYNACYNCGVPGHLSRQCTEKRGIPKRVLCTNCHQTGHHQRQCDSLPSKKAKNIHATCIVCQKEGHLCCEDVKWEGSLKAGDIWCYNCGKKGHHSTECSRPASDFCHTHFAVKRHKTEMAKDRFSKSSESSDPDQVAIIQLKEAFQASSQQRKIKTSSARWRERDETKQASYRRQDPKPSHSYQSAHQSSAHENGNHVISHEETSKSCSVAVANSNDVKKPLSPSLYGESVDVSRQMFTEQAPVKSYVDHQGGGYCGESLPFDPRFLNHFRRRSHSKKRFLTSKKFTKENFK